MDVRLVAGGAAPLPGGDPVAKAKNPAEAAQQFEALLPMATVGLSAAEVDELTAASD